MNTEIKFRGWSIEGKKWLYGGVLFFKDGTAIMPDGEENDKMITSPVDPESIGQFTGLYDKDGNEIFGGDILNNGGENQNIAVKFERGCFWCYPDELLGYESEVIYEMDSAPYVIFRDCDPSKWATVVGNTYFNPELLTRKS